MARRLVLLAVFLAVACHAAPALAASRRPAGTGHELGAAEVLWARGKAIVKPKTGEAFGAAQGMQLFRSDELSAPLGGFVLVELANGHLARIDEEITLVVRDIALVDAPATADDRNTQLDRLLSQDEAKEAGQRVVGYHAGMRAAESVSVEAPRAHDLVMGGASGTAGPATPMKSFGARPEARANQKKSGEDATSDDDSLSKIEAPRELAAPRWLSLAGKEPGRARPGRLPEAIARALADGKVAACLAAEVARTRAPVSGPIRLLVRVDAGTIKLVRLAGGAAAGACAQMALVGAPVPEALGRRWMVLELPR